MEIIVGAAIGYTLRPSDEDRRQAMMQDERNARAELQYKKACKKRESCKEMRGHYYYEWKDITIFVHELNGNITELAQKIRFPIYYNPPVCSFLDVLRGHFPFRAKISNWEDTREAMRNFHADLLKLTGGRQCHYNGSLLKRFEEHLFYETDGEIPYESAKLWNFERHNDMFTLHVYIDKVAEQIDDPDTTK